MDKSLFVSMNGAKNSMRELEIVTNNLANANTTGFRGDATYSSQYHSKDAANETRVYAKLAGTFTDFTQGPILNTQRDLDVAIDGPGFIAVQSLSGKEGYTRAGDLQIDETGALKTSRGELVMGNAGTISIPQAQRISIGPDGMVLAQFAGQNDMVPIDQIKLINPDVNKLSKGEDRLFYLPQGTVTDADPSVKIIPGALEGSNVNVIEAMTKIIDLSRSYEIHTNFMKTMSENSIKANGLLDLPK